MTGLVHGPTVREGPVHVTPGHPSNPLWRTPPGFLYPRLLLPLACFVCLLPSAQAQEPTTPAQAAALVERAVDRSLTQAKTHHPLRFELRKIDSKRDTTKEIIETSDGDVARLIAIAGKPLPADADQAERARLTDLLAHPELEAKRQHDEARDADRVSHLLRLLPQAFLYTPAGTAPCANGTPGGSCYRLSFKPNPDWSPPDLESSLLKSLAGELQIDQAQGFLARLDAVFIQNADVGLGMLARIAKGGTVSFVQSDIGTSGHDWEITSVKLDLTGKLVLFKSLSINTTQQMTHFEPVPDTLDYRTAIQLLLK